MYNRHLQMGACRIVSATPALRFFITTIICGHLICPGVSRLTTCLAVIMLEVTADLPHLLPIMCSVMVAKVCCGVPRAVLHGTVLLCVPIAHADVLSVFFFVDCVVHPHGRPGARDLAVVWGGNQGERPGLTRNLGDSLAAAWQRLGHEVTCPTPCRAPWGSHDGTGRAPPGGGGLQGSFGFPCSPAHPGLVLCPLFRCSPAPRSVPGHGDGERVRPIPGDRISSSSSSSSCAVVSAGMQLLLPQ